MMGQLGAQNLRNWREGKFHLFLFQHIIVINIMTDSFDNPFDLDEEHLQMIALENNKTLESTVSPPPETPPTVQPPSKQSMFDLLETEHGQAEKQSQPTQVNQDDDPPLLEDIGIDPLMIRKRMMAILNWEQGSEELVAAPDLWGPVAIGLTLGGLLMLGGKMHFSDIEGGFLLGTLLLYFFFNFMNRMPQTISLYNVMSLLGYSLLPMLFLALVGVFVTLKGEFGLVGSLVLSGWSSYSCSNMFSVMLNRSDSKILIQYPLFLFYLKFALIILY